MAQDMSCTAVLSHSAPQTLGVPLSPIPAQAVDTSQALKCAFCLFCVPWTADASGARFPRVPGSPPALTRTCLLPGRALALLCSSFGLPGGGDSPGTREQSPAWHVLPLPCMAQARPGASSSRNMGRTWNVSGKMLERGGHVLSPQVTLIPRAPAAPAPRGQQGPPHPPLYQEKGPQDRFWSW